MKKIILIDANHLLSRTFHVPTFQSLKAKIGENTVPTGATYGFLVSLKSIFLRHKERDDKVIVVWDGGRGFRKKLSPDYKANRTERTDAFIFQFGLTRKFLKTLGIVQYMFEDVEADDVIGVLARRARLAKYKVLIISGDKDFNQLVSRHVHVLNPKGNNEYRMMTPQSVKDDYGIPPNLFVEWLALVGDSSDNITGVEGVGKKTATDLVLGNGTVEDILSADKHFKLKDGEKKAVSKKMQEKINASKDVLRLARQLVEIQCDLNIDLTVDPIKPEFHDLKGLFKKYAFNTFLRNFNEFVAVFS